VLPPRRRALQPGGQVEPREPESRSPCVIGMSELVDDDARQFRASCVASDGTSADVLGFSIDLRSPFRVSPAVRRVSPAGCG